MHTHSRWRDLWRNVNVKQAIKWLAAREEEKWMFVRKTYSELIQTLTIAVQISVFFKFLLSCHFHITLHRSWTFSISYECGSDSCWHCIDSTFSDSFFLYQQRRTVETSHCLAQRSISGCGGCCYIFNNSQPWNTIRLFQSLPTKKFFSAVNSTSDYKLFRCCLLPEKTVTVALWTLCEELTLPYRTTMGW